MVVEGEGVHSKRLRENLLYLACLFAISFFALTHFCWCAITKWMQTKLGDSVLSAKEMTLTFRHIPLWFLHALFSFRPKHLHIKLNIRKLLAISHKQQLWW